LSTRLQNQKTITYRAETEELNKGRESSHTRPHQQN